MNWLDYWLKRKDLVARAKQCWPLWITLSSNFFPHETNERNIFRKKKRDLEFHFASFTPWLQTCFREAIRHFVCCRVFVAQHKVCQRGCSTDDRPIEDRNPAWSKQKCSETVQCCEHQSARCGLSRFLADSMTHFLGDTWRPEVWLCFVNQGCSCAPCHG